MTQRSCKTRSPASWLAGDHAFVDAEVPENGRAISSPLCARLADGSDCALQQAGAITLVITLPIRGPSSRGLITNKKFALQQPFELHPQPPWNNPIIAGSACLRSGLSAIGRPDQPGGPIFSCLHSCTLRRV